jgi:hypothetical protein
MEENYRVQIKDSEISFFRLYGVEYNLFWFSAAHRGLIRRHLRAINLVPIESSPTGVPPSHVSVWCYIPGMILVAGRPAGRISAAITETLLVVLGINEIRDCLCVLKRVGGYAIAGREIPMWTVP